MKIVIFGKVYLVLACNANIYECEENLPKPEIGYIQYPHKGGADLKQPLTFDEITPIII